MDIKQIITRLAAIRNRISSKVRTWYLSNRARWQKFVTILTEIELGPLWLMFIIYAVVSMSFIKIILLGVGVFYAYKILVKDAAAVLRASRR